MVPPPIGSYWVQKPGMGSYKPIALRPNAQMHMTIRSYPIKLVLQLGSSVFQAVHWDMSLTKLSHDVADCDQTICESKLASVQPLIFALTGLRMLIQDANDLCR